MSSTIQSGKGTNALVWGGSGFLGSNLVQKLIACGENVTILDRTAPPMSSSARFSPASFDSDFDFFASLRDMDVVYHLISTSTPASNLTLEQEIAQNVTPTEKLLQACVSAGVKRVVFLSSGGTVYGRGAQRPLRENDPLCPICNYGKQKVLIEELLRRYQANYGLSCRIVRLANPYGVLQDPMRGQGVIPAFVYAVLHHKPVTLYGDGSTVRDYLCVDDAVEGIFQIAHFAGSETTFNLGSGIGTSLLTVLRYVEAAVGAAADLRFLSERSVDVHRNVLDISRYLQFFSPFHPVKLEEGIRRLVLSYQALER